MDKKILEKYDAENEAFERYLYAIGTSIAELNKQVEEVD